MKWAVLGFVGGAALGVWVTWKVLTSHTADPDAMTPIRGNADSPRPPGGGFNRE